jgi:predicted DNA-binding transcriptional regulator AlpA
MKKHERLVSWKEISEYIKRDIRTCYRWAKELGLPVRRIDDQSKQSRVFAYKDEIDEWFAQKQTYQEERKKN